VTLTLILFRVDTTSNVHYLDFNTRILILEMHGTNIKIINLFVTFLNQTDLQKSVLP
jgi:hypothetical protein